jgi:hypothetical protein
MTARARPFTLPDDGIIDAIAIEIAVAGIRPVALTRTERLLAAGRILAGGGTPHQVARHLHLSGATALVLAARIRASQPGTHANL